MCDSDVMMCLTNEMQRCCSYTMTLDMCASVSMIVDGKVAESNGQFVRSLIDTLTVY